MKEVLFETLVDGVSRGLRANSEYKRDVWIAAEKTMKTRLNINVSVKQLKNKHDEFKTKFKI